MLKPRTLAAMLVLLLASVSVRATEAWEPYQPVAEQTQIRVWTAQGITYAQVTFTFSDAGFRVTDWGSVERNGRELSVDVKAERWTGASVQVITFAEHTYALGALSQEAGAGLYTFAVRSRGAFVKAEQFDPSKIQERWEAATLPANRVVVAIRTTGGVTFTFITLNFPDDGYRVVDWGQVTRAGSELSIDLKLEHWTGQVSTRGAFARQSYVLGELPAGAYNLSIKFQGETARTQPFNVGASSSPFQNPTDDPAFFVRQHYLDFFSREPDSTGLTFWTDQIIVPCGGLSPCMEASRISPSGAFFLSIEFHETGYLAHRLYKAAFGRTVRFVEFLPDTQELGRGFIVGAQGWQQKLAANKDTFVASFVGRPEFTSKYPGTLTPEQYVDALNANTKSAQAPVEPGATALSQTERDALVEGLKKGTETRATVLRKVAEDADFERQEFNRAFVQMQYFGYLRRDAEDAGLQFWLKKLEEHHGDYIAAEMVKAFINSSEYRQRFEHTPQGVPTGEPFRLKVGEAKSVQPDNLRVEFVSVIDDSRCPRDVQCVWAGEAKIRLRVTKPGEAPLDLTLSIRGGVPRPDHTNPSVEALGYRFTLLQLDPESQAAAASTPYEALLVVTKS